MVLGAGLLLVSLSRSIIIAAAIWPLLLIGRALVTGRVSKRNQFTGIAVLAGAVVMGLAGVWDLLDGTVPRRDELLRDPSRQRGLGVGDHPGRTSGSGNQT
ncbi:MAG: hypothetical protein WKF47_05545 [Geodermatophilaceae bacterium]